MSGHERAGLLVIDKEPGWTSHDVVGRIRSILGERRVGHAGSLDPDATGVLVVGVGKATRLLRFITALPKLYTGQMVLGTATSTLDASGEVVGEWDMTEVTLKDLERAARSLTGEISQVPPMVSALKVGGRRLHELARRGEEVDRAPRTVRVDRFEVCGTGAGGVFGFLVACSSGTYIRSLVAALGEALGGGAHVRLLRREAVGSFTAEEARRVGEVSEDDLLGPEEALRDYSRLEASPELVSAVRHGAVLDRRALGLEGDGPWAVVDGKGTLLGVYEATASERVKPSVVLRT